MRIKLFENFNNPELLDNIKDIFQDLSDDDIVSIHTRYTQNEYDIPENTVMLFVYVPSDIVNSNNFEKLFEQKKKHFSIFQEVKNCIDRLKIAHNDSIDVYYEYYEDSDHNYVLELHISEGETTGGEFWKLSNDGLIRIDYDELKEYLKLPKNVNIGMSSDGSQKILGFYFKTAEDLDNHTKDLIDQMLKIKIQDKEMVADYTWTYGGFSGDDRSKYKIYKNYNRHRSTGYYDNREDIVHYISFGLNKDLNFNW